MLSSKITLQVFLYYFLDPFVCDGNMMIYANVPMYIDWISSQKKAHEITGNKDRDDSSDVGSVMSSLFDTILCTMLMLQIY